MVLINPAIRDKIRNDLEKVAGHGESKEGFIEYGPIISTYEKDGINHLNIRYYLEDISRSTVKEHDFMLSAVVVMQNTFRPGGGFYTLAEELGILRKRASEQEKDKFHNKQLELCWKYYKK